MAQANIQQPWIDDSLLQQLIAASGEKIEDRGSRIEDSRMVETLPSSILHPLSSIFHLLGRPECVNQTLIRALKDQVSYWVRVDIPRAVELAHVTRELAALSDDPICAALAAHAGAQAAHVSGQHAEAIGLYEQAEAIYARLGEESELARIIRAKVSPLMHLGEYEKSLHEAARACEIFQRHDQPILLAQTLENMGNIHHRLDQYHEALKFYDRARQIYVASRWEPGVASVSFNEANQYTALNEFERALALYQQAQAIYEKLSLPLLVVLAEYSIAWLYFQRGRFQESLALFAKVRTRAQELGDTTLEALCDLDLSEVYLQLNAYEDAIEQARSARQKFSAVGMGYESAKATMYLGIAHSQLNDVAEAESCFQEARRGFLAEGNQIFTAQTNIYLSDVLIRQQKWDLAVQLCTEAKDHFIEQELPAKAAYAQLQLARIKINESMSQRINGAIDSLTHCPIDSLIDEAVMLCQSGLELLGDAEVPWLKYQCSHLLGRAAQCAGQEAKAYQHYVTATEHLETIRRSIWVDEFKCTFMQDKLLVYEDLVDLCLRAGTEEKIDEAFAHAQAAKSRALVELLATDRSIRGKAEDPSLAQLHQEWQRVREELDWYYNRINFHGSQPQQGPLLPQAELQQRVHEREQQVVRLARRLSLEDAEYASLQTVPRLDTQQVRQCLAEDEVLIEYFLVDGRVQVFLLSREAARVFNDMSTLAAFAPLLQRLKFQFDQLAVSQRTAPSKPNSLEAITRQYLRRLYSALVEPIEPFIQDKKLIIAPHSFLHYVPFHALDDGSQYLIDRHEISYCPSGSVYKLCFDKARTPRACGRVLIVGLSDDAAPLIREEVSLVGSLWEQADVLVGEEATLDQLKCHAPGCRLLHLATHGVFRRDNPLFSALKLSDSWLTFYDIFKLNLNAELVTLSACETGMNEVSPGDELLGLLRGFLYAGAPTVIVSLWMVNDRSTLELMRWFYTGLRDGLTKRAALQQAQLKVKQQYPHAYYWAPFMLMGSPL